MPRDTENEDFDAMLPEIEDDNEAQMTRVLSEFDKTEDNVSLQIKIYRISTTANVKGQKEAFLFYADPSEFPILERVRDEYGSGIYRVRIYKTVGNSTQMVRAFDFQIEAKQTRVEAPRAPGSDMSVVLAAIEKQNQTMMAFMERMMERPAVQPQTIDPLAMMERTLSMAGSLAGLRPEPSQNVMTPDAMITLITKGMEIANTAKGSDSGGAGETNWMDLVKGFFASPLAESFAKSALPQPQAPVHQTQSFIPAPQIPPQQPPAPSMDETRALMLQQIITTLGNFSIQGTDPGAPVVLDWFFNNVPEAMIDALLQDATALDRLSEAFPVIRDRRGWFTAFLAEVQKAGAEPIFENERANNGSHGDTGRTGGGEGNPQSDAAPFNRDAPDRSTH